MNLWTDLPITTGPSYDSISKTGRKTYDTNLTSFLIVSCHALDKTTEGTAIFVLYLPYSLANQSGSHIF